MARINFFTRGTTPKRRIYFRYRPGRLCDISLATPFEIDADNWDPGNQSWDTSQIVKGAKSGVVKIRNSKIEAFNRELADFRGEISGFIDRHRDKRSDELKVLLSKYVLSTYFAHKMETDSTSKKPEKIHDLIDFYIQYRSVEDKTKGSKPIAANTVKKYKTLQKILFEFDKALKVTSIDDVWRVNFVNYLNDLQYAASSQVKFIKDIRMLCAFAEDEHSINKKVLKWKINRNPEPISKGLHFTFEQIECLKTTIMPTESLDNARDWLLISCYTSVRVSELLAMDANNIITDNLNQFIMVQERKNINHKDKGMKCIYLLPEVVKILQKRGGQFPRKISEQKYNQYIKLVCKEARFLNEIEGGKQILENGITRKRKGTFAFWELVTSHIGRATYVSLFSQYLPAEIIQMQTNHHSREMVEHYNKTELTEKLLQRAKVVAEAHNNVQLKIV